MHPSLTGKHAEDGDGDDDLSGLQRKIHFSACLGPPPQRALSILENRSSRIFGMTISNLCLWPKKLHFLKKDVGDGVYADHTDDYDQRYEQVSPRFSLHISFAIVGFSILINISR